MSTAVKSAVAGIDEAGRGPLAGPVVAAVVVLRSGQRIEGVNDSKKLSALRRNQLVSVIQAEALDWAIGSANVKEIDDLNILHATMLAMSRAWEQLQNFPPEVQVDGNRLPDLKGYTGQATAVVGGDLICPAISAASILAKVERDALMLALDKDFPVYGFAKHKGYPTVQHREALRVHGPCPEHRRSFRPVRDAIEAMRGAA
ncbi:MAG: ribonuclease HII [Gammaproteobacteria bacterium]|nr:ribonuclease HII [Gammaproteobacteria bacterium]